MVLNAVSCWQENLDNIGIDHGGCDVHQADAVGRLFSYLHFFNIHIVMISVENFYWVLHKNLLQPSELDCWFYYPFGTTQYLCRGHALQPYYYRLAHLNHVLFHFDQEPLWTDSLGEAYDNNAFVNYWVTNVHKRVKILANSEISQLKKNLCKDRRMLDWYFFYHGFAALDWFRDSQYIQENLPFKKTFSSFNHIISDYRSYRISLLARLYASDLLNYGYVSFHGTWNDCLRELEKKDSQISDQSKSLITKNLSATDQLPLIVDRRNVDATFSARFGYQEYEMWQQSFLHIVNETVFYAPKLHLTEKIFKPIVCLRPFILSAAPGNLAYLKNYGFRTFETWIDESYDDVTDPDQRLDMIVAQVGKFCKLSNKEQQDIYQDMLPTLQHNKRHFFSEFRKIIVEEMVNNFDTCLRIWNNGRVDGRELPLPQNLKTITNILLQ